MALGIQYQSAMARNTETVQRADTGTILLPNVKLVAQVPGWAKDLAVQGDYVAALYEGGLGLTNVADPSFPRSTGWLTLPGDGQENMFLDGQYAYIAWGASDMMVSEGGLQIVDISNPTAPQLIGSLSSNNTQTNVTKRGHFVFWNDSVIDVSDPTTPISVGTSALDHSIIEEEYPGESPLIYSHDIYHFSITDASIPTATTVITTVHSQSMILDGAIYSANSTPWRNYLYLTHYAYHPEYETGGLEVIDVTDPAHPRSVAWLNETTDYYKIVISGDYAVVSSEQGLHIFDLSNPAAPQEIGSYTACQSISALVSRGKYIYLANGDQGLQILDMSTPSVPTRLGVQANTVPMNDISMVGHYGYIPSWHGLDILDLFNPVAPILLGSLAMPHGASTVAVTGEYALAAKSYSDEVWVVNISDPSAPVLTSKIMIWGRQAKAILTRKVDEQTYAYIAASSCDPEPDIPCEGTLEIFDISEPLTPTQRYRHALPWRTTALETDENQRLFVALAQQIGSTQLAMFDSDPLTPTLVTTMTLDVASYIKDMDIQGNYAYLVYWQGLAVIDISSPTTLEQIGQYEYILPPGSTQSGLDSIAVDGTRAYLADAYHGTLVVLDIVDPAHPQEIARLSMPGSGSGLTLSNGYLYASNGDGGLSIYRYRANNGTIIDVNGRPFSGVIVNANEQKAAASGLTGDYALTDISLDTYTMKPEMRGYAFWPPNRIISDTENPQGQNFVILPAPVSTTLASTQPTTLSYVDTEGLLTQLEFPISPSGTALAVLTPTIATDGFGMAFAGHAFNLQVSPEAHLLDALGAPVSVTLQYSQANTRIISDENTLTLYWWDGNAWVDATTTCPTPTGAERDLANKTITSAICETGAYALFGSTHRVFLPFATHK